MVNDNDNGPEGADYIRRGAARRLRAAYAWGDLAGRLYATGIMFLVLAGAPRDMRSWAPRWLFWFTAAVSIGAGVVVTWTRKPRMPK